MIPHSFLVLETGHRLILPRSYDTGSHTELLDSAQASVVFHAATMNLLQYILKPTEFPVEPMLLPLALPSMVAIALLVKPDSQVFSLSLGCTKWLPPCKIFCQISCLHELVVFLVFLVGKNPGLPLSLPCTSCPLEGRDRKLVWPSCDMLLILSPKLSIPPGRATLYPDV